MLFNTKKEKKPARIDLRNRRIIEILPKEGDTAMSTCEVATQLKLHQYTALASLAEMYMDGIIGMAKFKKSRYWYKKGDEVAL